MTTPKTSNTQYIKLKTSSGIDKFSAELTKAWVKMFGMAYLMRLGAMFKPSLYSILYSFAVRLTSLSVIFHREF